MFLNIFKDRDYVNIICIGTILSLDSEAPPNSVGSYGDILVTPATVFGNGPITGHAGMVDLNPDFYNREYDFRRS